MNDDAAIELLTKMVRIPSPSGEEGELAGFLVDALARLGFDSRLDEVGNVVATLGDGPREAVLLGHVDTVPGAIPVRVEAGRLYGRGSVDAKGCLAAFVAAAVRAADAGTLAERVTIVGCVEEEVASSRGARHAVAREAPDWCIVGEPSGWDRITLGYKGHLQTRLRFRQPLAHGAAAGENAAERACRTWGHLHEGAAIFNFGRERLYDQLLLRLDRIESDADGLVELAQLVVSLRLPEDLPPGVADDWIATVAPGVERESSAGIAAWSGKRTTPLHHQLFRTIAALGGRPAFQRKTGTADLNIVAPAWGCPALAYGPGDSALDHHPDEHLQLEELLRSIQVLERMLAWAPAGVGAVGTG